MKDKILLKLNYQQHLKKYYYWAKNNSFFTNNENNSNKDICIYIDKKLP